MCVRPGSPNNTLCLILKVCARSKTSKSKWNFTLNNVPLSVLALIKELKAYLRSHLSLGIITSVGYFFKGRKKVWLQTKEELVQLVRKELTQGKGTLWCEAAAQTSGHQVDCSGEEDLTGDQEEEIQPKKKTKSLGEEKCVTIQI